MRGKYFLLLFGLTVICSLFVHINFTSAISYIRDIEEKKFHVGDTVTIHGEGFGDPSSLYSWLCFNDDTHCYNYSSKGILHWSDTTITFVFPSWVASYSGTITISNGFLTETCTGGYYSYCYNTTKTKMIGSYYYSLLPTIDVIADSESDTRSFALPGETLYLNGTAFGYRSGSIYFGSIPSKVLSWTDTRIVVQVPEVKQQTYEIKLLRASDQELISQPFVLKASLSNDPLSSMQEYLTNAHIDILWTKLKPKKTITVAVIDDGVYYNHPDLKDAIWENTGEILGNGLDDDKNGYTDDRYGWDFYYDTNDITQNEGHGTSVAGIIASKKDNGVGIAGIARKVKIMPLIACNDIGCSTDAIIAAMNYAIDNGARVINLSLSTPNISKYTTAYDAVIEKANSKNVVLVIAAGNGDTTKKKGIDTTKFPLSPVCNEKTTHQIIGVGASTFDNQFRTDFSNYGKCVDVYAQGELTLTTGIDEDYGFEDGTSFSAPIVTGVVAEILSAYPTLSNKKLFTYISKYPVLDAEKVVNDIIRDKTKTTKKKTIKK